MYGIHHPYDSGIGVYNFMDSLLNKFDKTYHFDVRVFMEIRVFPLAIYYFIVKSINPGNPIFSYLPCFFVVNYCFLDAVTKTLLHFKTTIERRCKRKHSKFQNSE